MQEIPCEKPQTIVLDAHTYEMIFLRRVAPDRWQGMGRCAFLAALLLPGYCLRCFCSEGTAVAEIIRPGMDLLGLRTRLLDEIGDEVVVFGTSVLPTASDVFYQRWTASLPQQWVTVPEL